MKYNVVCIECGKSFKSDSIFSEFCSEDCHLNFLNKKINEKDHLFIPPKDKQIEVLDESFFDDIREFVNTYSKRAKQKRALPVEESFDFIKVRKRPPYKNWKKDHGCTKCLHYRKCDLTWCRYIRTTYQDDNGVEHEIEEV